MIHNHPLLNVTALTALLVTGNAFAVDRVYHPYVQPLERELEYRVTGYNDGNDNPDAQTHRLGFGYGINDRMALDAYMIGNKDGGDDLRLQAYELELLWQLNEQGAGWLDSALQFELERANDGGYTEISTGFIAEKEIGARWSATVNIAAVYEFGDEVQDELDSEIAAQLRYRFDRLFEPAIEIYADEYVSAAGPAASGTIILGGRNRLMWEAAALITAEHDVASRIFRAALEWEF